MPNQAIGLDANRSTDRNRWGLRGCHGTAYALRDAARAQGALEGLAESVARSLHELFIT